MAAWTYEQQVRLAYEETLLKQQLPHFEFFDRTQAGMTTVQGTYVSSTGNSYGLAIWLPAGFNDTIPGLYVTSPHPLPGYGGRPVETIQALHSMHVWKSDWGGYVKICHGREENWSASNTLVGVIMKGFLWLEALEAHRLTGNDIDTYSITE